MLCPDRWHRLPACAPWARCPCHGLRCTRPRRLRRPPWSGLIHAYHTYVSVRIRAASARRPALFLLALVPMLGVGTGGPPLRGTTGQRTRSSRRSPTMRSLAPGRRVAPAEPRSGGGPSPRGAEGRAQGRKRMPPRSLVVTPRKRDACATGRTGEMPVPRGGETRCCAPTGGTGFQPVDVLSARKRDAYATGCTGKMPVPRRRETRCCTPTGGTGFQPVQHGQDARATGFDAPGRDGFGGRPGLA